VSDLQTRAARARSERDDEDETSPRVERADGSDTRQPAETRWLRAFVIGSATAVLSFGAFGLVLADHGEYSAPRAFGLGVVGWVALLWLLRPVLAAPGRSDREGRLANLAAFILAGSVAIWNALHVSQHVLTDRDPAIYNNTGRWIAGHGSLQVFARLGPFAVPPFDVSAAGLYPIAGQKQLVFQFPHLLPALLAESRAVGGDRLMFRTVPLLGGVALLAFFLVASRVLRRPWFAFGAMACLAFAMPEIYFSRDTYSEIPLQILFFTGVRLFLDEGALRRWRVALCAGLMFGALEAVRIDALAIVASLPIVYTVAWYRTPRGQRKPLAVSAIVAAAGTTLGLYVGLNDLHSRSQGYWNDLHSETMQLIALVILSAVFSVALIGAEPILRTRLAWLRDAPLRIKLANLAAAAVVVIAIVGWFVRPAVMPLKKVITDAYGAPIPALRIPDQAYYARAVSWFAWYLGPITLALAIVGLALVARRLVLRLRWIWVVPVAFLGPETFLYLWRPNAAPDHVWITRRLLVAGFPAVILLAIGLLAALYARREMWAHVVSVVLVVAAVAYPMVALFAVRNMSEETGYLSVIRRACDIAGPNAAVVVVTGGTQPIHLTVPQPMRGWCGIPTAQYRGNPNPAAMTAAAEQWKAMGRQLWLIAQTPKIVQQWVPSAQPKVTNLAVARHKLTAPRTNRPRGYQQDSLQVALAPVPTS
jgi:hypothetical protein